MDFFWVRPRLRWVCARAALAVALAVAGCEEDPPSRPPPLPDVATPASLQATAWARLRAESSVEARVRVDRDGAVRFARFSVPAGSGDPLEQALAFLERHRDFYRLRDPRRDLLPMGVARGAGAEATVLFHQRIGALPVVASELQVHLVDGRVRSTVGRYLVALPAVAAPSLNAGAARARAAALGGASGAAAVPYAPRPVAFAASLRGGPSSAPPVPAWMAVVRGPSGEERVVLDAVTGSVLDREALQRDDGESFLISDANNSDSRATRLNNCFWDHLGAVIDQNGALADQDRRRCLPGLPCIVTHPEPPAEAWTLEPNLRRVWNWYTDRFRHYGWNGLGMRAHAAVLVSFAQPNATFDPTCNMMKFSPGRERPPDTTAHEFTHGVSYHASLRRGELGGLYYDGVTGALEESLADTFAAFVNGDWRYAENSPAAGCTAEGAQVLRYLADPPRCGHPDHFARALSGDGTGYRSGAATAAAGGCGVPAGMCSTTVAQCCNDQLGVHTNSGIFNKVAFLLTGSLVDTDGAPTVSNTHPGSRITVRGIGIRKARALYYQVVTRRLSRNINQDVFREVMIDQAELFTEPATPALYPSLIGLSRFTREDVCSVRNAFAAVGVGQSDVDCNGVEDGGEDDPDHDGVAGTLADGGLADNCPLVPNPGQENSDLPPDALGDACDPDIDGDGRRNPQDNCPLVSNPPALLPDGGVGQPDNDGDGQGDACDDDECPGGQGDGVPWASDNCPTACNPRVAQPDGAWAQPDDDGDAVGNACDPDSDNDGVNDRDVMGRPLDNCPAAANASQQDGDGDRVGDACDNCVARGNGDQADLDSDRQGDVCDPDPDGDDVPRAPALLPLDNCPSVYNPDQGDGDGDGVGAACDPQEIALLRDNAPFDLIARYRGGSFGSVEIAACSTRCPEPPCDLAPLCPAILRLDQSAVRFRVTTDGEANARITDDLGNVVAQSLAATVHDLSFTPSSSFFWRAPDRVLSTRAYFVQVWAAGDRSPGLDQVHYERVLGDFPPTPDAGPPDAALDAAPDATPDATPDAVLDVAPDGMDATASDAAPPDAGDAPVVVGVCPSGRTTCGGRCVNVFSDASHCGGCGRPCASGRVCASGRCATTCPAPLTTCPLGDAGSACVNLATDVDNCGACGTRCAAGQRCARTSPTSVQCYNPASFCASTSARPHMCGELCVDHLTDTGNCGGCSIRCAPSQACVDGACVLLP